MGLLLGAPSFIFSNSEYRDDSFLFCLKKNEPILEISRSNDGKISSIQNNNQIQSFFNHYDLVDLHQWMPNANENDYDGDIYLNRIYRVYVGDNRSLELPSIIDEISKLSSVLYSEYENIHKITYTPNDSNLETQCSLSAINAFEAWDFWDMENGNSPGDDNQSYVLLASVDTGVDYSHPDLQSNAWINQGEIPSWAFEIGIDINDDGFVEADEIVSFLESNSMDYNGDNQYNLRDLVYEGDPELNNGSPFLDGIDSDGNSYTDDLLGWDASGYYGNTNAADPDPYPKEGVANSGTWAHGTHVAGILAATTDNGMGMASTAYNAKFISVKASKDNQSSDDPGINHGYQGILYAAKAGHNDLNGNGTWDQGESFAIINNSWGGGGFSNSENTTINTAHNTYGAVVVGAAGNGDDSGGDEYAAHYPSSYENCVSVCAMACSGNWGNWATYHPTIDLGAPGESIFSAIIGSGYESWDGSSMASPNAASAFGLLSYYYPDFDNNQLRERIEATADDVVYELSPEFIDCNGSSGEYCLGSGMVDVYKAIGLTFSPSISFNSYSLNMTSGDGDDVLNPGESANLIVSLTNQDGWTDAQDVQVTLSCNSPFVHISNNSCNYGNISSGVSVDNADNVFSFYTDSDIELEDVVFNVEVSAMGADDFNYSNTLSFEIPLSLNQSGFPFETDFEVKSSPLVVDLNGDGELELIFGDKNNLVHVVSSTGVEWENDIFPFDAENEIWGSLAYADLDLDGISEIIIPSKNKHLYAVNINGVLFDFDAGQFLMGTPAIGNLDEDDYLEVVVSGYTSSGDVFIVNHDGSSSSVEINEKALGGVSLADFNNDNIDEIIIATENNDMICMIDYLGQIDTLLTAEDKFKGASGILDVSGQKIILAGSNDSNLYALDSTSEIIFTYNAGDEINSSPSFIQTTDGALIVIGSDDGFLHGVYSDGSTPSGWPVYLGNAVGTSSFSDLDGDGSPEILVGAGNYIHALDLNGDYFNSNHFPLQTEFSITSAPIIVDFDQDNDLEIIVGTSADVVVIDVMNEGGISTGYWNLDRGGEHRKGYYESDLYCGTIFPGDVNCDSNVDIFDIVSIVNIILDITNPSEMELWSADINQDQTIDVNDILIIINDVLD